MSENGSDLPRPQVAYLGPPASFSHQAALNFFEKTADLHPADTFAEVFASVQRHHAPHSKPEVEESRGMDYGVVPIENSSNGSVVQLLDLLADHDDKYSCVKVCAEYYLPVHHFLLVAPRDGEAKGEPKSRTPAEEGIEKIYTHPQVWGQCSRFLAKHMKGVERIDVGSTSLAARIARGDGNMSEVSSPKIAAIASKLAGDMNGLEFLAENIEDEGNNTTRFLVLYNQQEKKVGTLVQGGSGSGVSPVEQQGIVKWKSLISFTIEHEAPGSLADALEVFKEFGFNLTSIDTRPSRQRPWHYIFFVECEESKEIRAHEENRSKMLAELKKHTQSYKHLGCWEDQLEKGRDDLSFVEKNRESILGAT